MGWITPAIQSLQKGLLLVSKSLNFAVSIVSAAIFSYYVIKTIPSNAESCEEQDGSKQTFVEGTMAKIHKARFCLGVAKKWKRNENERFKLTPLKKATFPASFND